MYVKMLFVDYCVVQHLTPPSPPDSTASSGTKGVRHISSTPLQPVCVGGSVGGQGCKMAGFWTVDEQVVGE